MKEVIKLSLLFLFGLTALSFSSCGDGDDDEKNDTNVNTPLPPNNSTDSGYDGSVYNIVGTWKSVYYWTYSGITEVCTMEIKANGTLAYTNESSSNGLEEGDGTWTYNKSTQKYVFRTGSSLYSGEYVLLGNQLVQHVTFEDGSSRTVTFNRQ